MTPLIHELSPSRRRFMAELRFDDRVVIVTGGGRGIGPRPRPSCSVREARRRRGSPTSAVRRTAAAHRPGPADTVVAEIQASGGEGRRVVRLRRRRRQRRIDRRHPRSTRTAGSTSWSTTRRHSPHGGRSCPNPPDDFPSDARRALLRHAVRHPAAAWPHFVNAGYGRIVKHPRTESVFSGTRLDELLGGQGRPSTHSRRQTSPPKALRTGSMSTRSHRRAFTRMSEFAFAAYPEEGGVRQARAMLAPELNRAPARVYLAHEIVSAQRRSAAHRDGQRSPDWRSCTPKASSVIP